MPRSDTTESHPRKSANESSDRAPAFRGGETMSGMVVKVGSHKWTVPMATILAGCLSAAGVAYHYVDEHAKAYAERLEALEQKVKAQDNALEIERITLVEIRAQLTRIDARVAEVQVTLMRAGRP